MRYSNFLLSFRPSAIPPSRRAPLNATRLNLLPRLRRRTNAVWHGTTTRGCSFSPSLSSVPWDSAVPRQLSPEYVPHHHQSSSFTWCHGTVHIPTNHHGDTRIFLIIVIYAVCYGTITILINIHGDKSYFIRCHGTTVTIPINNGDTS